MSIRKRLTKLEAANHGNPAAKWISDLMDNVSHEAAGGEPAPMREPSRQESEALAEMFKRLELDA